jgi:hypothetical protein
MSTNARSQTPSDPTRPETPVDPMVQLRALGYPSVPKAKTVLRGHAVPAAQAAMASGVLGPLLRQAQASQACLQALHSVLPAGLLAQLQSGPITDGLWTLLVTAPAAAAKIRQWVPALQAHVRSKGWPVERIEVKVHRP